LESHLDPTQAGVLQGNPAVIPGWVRLGAALAVGLIVYTRTRRFDDIGLAAFVALTLLIFFLQAQGWSPQWLVQIIPLVLLALPNRTGVMVLVMLTLVTFAEYPLLFIRTGSAGGHISGALLLPFVVLVLTRTAILIGLCVALYRKLRQEPPPAATRNSTHA
jgi:NADH:ubiquinone oxidoreductase subunit K